MNQLSCQSCGSALEVEGFDRRLAVVHCSHCGVMFDLTKPRSTGGSDDIINAGHDVVPTTDGQQEAAENIDAESPREAGSRAVAAMPQGFSASGDDQHFAVTWAWRGASSVLLLGVACFWNVIVFRHLNAAGFDVVRGAFLAIGLGLLYRSIAGVINSTTISADEKWLKVRHAPLPWYPAPTIDSSSIEQLFVSEGFSETKDGNKTPYYLLNAVLRDNSLKRLSNRLPSIEPALYLEQEFERALQIRDRPVAGEVRGDTRHV